MGVYMKPNSASVEGEKSGQGTDATLQDEIGEPVKRSVDVSEMTTMPLALLMVYTTFQVCFPLCFQEDGLQNWSWLVWQTLEI